METSADGLRVYERGQLIADFGDKRCVYAYEGAHAECPDRVLLVTDAGEQRIQECNGDDVAYVLLAFDEGATPRAARQNIMAVLDLAEGAERRQLMRVYNNMHALAAFGVRMGWIA